VKPRARFLLVGLSVAAVSLSAQRRGSDTISVDSARALLGTDPLAVPDLPVRAIYALQGGRSVVVEQVLESGAIVLLREQRGGPAILFHSRIRFLDEDRTANERAALSGLPSPAERRSLDRLRHRYIKPLTVDLLSLSLLGWDRNGEQLVLLDRLKPVRQ
jgi:hypothetical protein